MSFQGKSARALSTNLLQQNVVTKLPENEVITKTTKIKETQNIEEYSISEKKEYPLGYIEFYTQFIIPNLENTNIPLKNLRVKFQGTKVNDGYLLNGLAYVYFVCNTLNHFIRSRFVNSKLNGPYYELIHNNGKYISLYYYLIDMGDITQRVKLGNFYNGKIQAFNMDTNTYRVFEIAKNHFPYSYNEKNQIYISENVVQEIANQMYE